MASGIESSRTKVRGFIPVAEIPAALARGWKIAKGIKKILCLILFIASLWSVAFARQVKEPNVAGTFYPDTPQDLRGMVDDLVAQAPEVAFQGEIFGLIVPHAGYGFSGPTAAMGYRLIKGRAYKTVVVIGSSHHHSFVGASVYPEGAFRTPLGVLEVDTEFARKLLDKDPEIAFVPQAFAKEHSVEVQLPFLQRSLPECKIVPVITGDCTLAACQKLAQLLKEAIGSRRDVLVIASTDMYHGYDYEEAEQVDRLTRGLLEQMDASGLYYRLREGQAQLCGGFGVVTTLILAKELGHNLTKVLGYTNSAVVTGQKAKGNWTVGYVSCVIDQEGEKGMLNKDQRRKLLELARKSIATYLATGRKLEVSETDPLLNQQMGAFVTLHAHGQLRGCIGNLIGEQPLYLTVRDMAVEAAVGDPRFPQVQPQELNGIEIELSVLSPMQKIERPEQIELGTHGVLVRRGGAGGVFLPQVATETGWSKEEFLSNLCSHKAGLPADAWKHKDTDLYVFTAEVFSEQSK